jgi:hypothetical protein
MGGRLHHTAKQKALDNDKLKGLYSTYTITKETGENELITPISLKRHKKIELIGDDKYFAMTKKILDRM